jgi:hypothetical protein
MLNVAVRKETARLSNVKKEYMRKCLSISQDE